MKKQSPVILLKAKGGKAFGALASLTDDSSLHLTWKVYSKVAEHLDQGQRIKNLSWRLWHLRDVMVTDEATSSSKSGKEVDVDQKSFNAMSASLANKLESDKKIPIDKLSAPEFRWTDSNDALRHKAIMRTKRRNASRKYVHSSTINKKAESKPKKDVVRNGNRENTHHSSLSPTTSTSSSSSSISFAPASRSSIVNRNNATTSRRTSSPPVCWRLTREQAIRQNKANGPLSEKSAGKQRQELKSTWTVQEIEDAERELKEQGVELSGPFLAMLTDLKTGELAKVNADEEEDVDDAVESIMDDDDGDLEDSHDLIAKREDEEDSRINQNLSGISLPATPTGKSSSLARRISNAGTNEDSFLSNTSRPKPQCVNCGATKTPLWRRDANFELQCNACGLYEKLHKAPRPKALKQRRNEKRSRNDNSPEDVQRNGVFSNGLNSPQSEFNNNQKDEWMGIHAGASCANCGTSTTPLWRKDREGRIICNACGLYYKLHNSHRPVTMRMDAIKRRSRYDDRRRTGSIAGLSVAGTPNRINPDEELLSKIFEHGTSSMMIPNTMHPNTPDTPNSLIGNPFFQNGMPNPNQMPLQPFQIQQFHPNHAPNSLPLSAGLTNHHNEVTMTHSHSHPHSLHDGIHIPTELWENQVCPMGAWGENCCQNLPQPSSVDIQTALMATDSSNTPVTDQAAVTAAMDALLNHGDWMTDYGQNKPLSSSEEHMGSQAGTPASNNPNGITFDPAAVTSNSSHISPAIGPSVPLKRRKLNSTIIAGTAKSPINNTNPAPSPSTNNIPIPTPISTTAGSNAETPANDWWSFPGSPSIKQ